DDRYFSDSFQFMPADGYTAMFQRMISSPLIDVKVSTDFSAIRGMVTADHTVYTGPIDAYFGHRYGHLPYRSLRFEHTHLPDVSRFQETGT
ncbi:UDP-galactopyranose mutase, partial [Acinetobacter baumannii]